MFGVNSSCTYTLEINSDHTCMSGINGGCTYMLGINVGRTFVGRSTEVAHV